MSEGYAFPMVEGLEPRVADDLSVLRAFLKDPAHTRLAEQLLAYDVPCSLEVSEGYLRIKTFPEGIGDSLLPLQDFMQEGQPHLAAMLYRGSFNEEEIQLTPQSEGHEMIAEKALSCEDIFVVYAEKNHTETSKIFAAIVRRLLGYNPQREDYKRYKKRIKAKNQADYRVADRVETIKINLEQYAFTYAGASTALQEAYLIALSAAGREELSAINEAISAISTGPATQKTPQTKLKRLLRSIRAIPTNSITYEDNGASVIQEAIIRLERHSAEEVEAELELLKNLARGYNDSDEWFSQIKELRKRLLVTLQSYTEPYISRTMQMTALSALDKLVAALQTAAEEKAKNPILQEYLSGISPDTLHKYLNPLDGTQPFVHKGCAVIDMDACRDEKAIIKALTAAERLIILGGDSTSSLFQLFLRAAYFQGPSRVIQLSPPKEEEKTFHWIYRKEKRFTAHVHEMDYAGHTIGMWTEEENFKPEGLEGIKTGSLSDLYHDSFDVLYWLVTKETPEEHLQIALNKANKCLAVVGEPGDFPVG